MTDTTIAATEYTVWFEEGYGGDGFPHIDPDFERGTLADAIAYVRENEHYDPVEYCLYIFPFGHQPACDKYGSLQEFGVDSTLVEGGR